MRTRKVYGLVSGQDGRYHLAVLSCGAEGWSVSDVKHWDSQNALRPLLQWNREITLGVSGVWKRTATGGMLDGRVQAESERQFVPYGLSSDIRHVAGAFVFNCGAVVPDDAYLATIPLIFSKESHNNFVAVFANDVAYRIGIIVDKKLAASFKMAPGQPEKLNGHLGRIERYWSLHYPGEQFPTVIYTLGVPASLPPEMAPGIPLSLGKAIDSNEVSLQAIGVALSPVTNAVPQFAGSTPEALHRKSRTLITLAAAAILMLTIVSTLAVFGLNQWYSDRARHHEKKYQQVFADNSDIRGLFQETNKTARSIMRLQETFSHQTTWARLLETLGKERPDGVFIERLGSQPVEQDKSRIQIAITGWVTNEALITDFIAKLQKMPYITSIKLSSMQRDKVKTSISQFKIICTLILNIR
jgi:Tfp pilus assembly protein PilN